MPDLEPPVIVTIVDSPRLDDGGILVEAQPKPDAAWLARQVDSRWRQHADAPWWTVMPLGGGALLVPEPLLRVLRAPTRDDVMRAVDHANDHGRRTIARLFPDIVADLLRQARP